jgi:hypothetical protein
MVMLEKKKFSYGRESKEDNFLSGKKKEDNL